MKHWQLLIPIYGVLYALFTMALEETFVNNKALYFTSAIWQVCSVLIAIILIVV